MNFPRCLSHYYPTLKPKLLRLAWLMEEQERQLQKLLEFQNRWHVAPADHRPYIRQDIKQYRQWSEFFKNEVNNTKNGELRDEMNNADIENAVGFVAHDLYDVRCIWVLSVIGRYTKGVLYLPFEPQKNAIIAEAERYLLPCSMQRV